MQILWASRTISAELAREVAVERHYLHRAPNVSYGLGLFEQDELMGIVTFGVTSSYRTALSVLPDSPKSVIELSRLWINPSAPQNSASWLVSRALKELPPYIVISYADTGIRDERNGRSHDGTIYKALSFNYAGRTKSKLDWCLPGTTRNVGKKVEGSLPVRATPKERYWIATGDRRQKRNLSRACGWPILQYDAQ